MDAMEILSTPVRADFEDYPAWHFDSKGVFSVKSAYKLFMNMQNKELSTSSGTNHENKFWKDLWDLPCLPKVKQFMWRLAHNSLPLRVNIEKRNIPCDTLCVCRKRLDEDGAHLFLKCKEAKEVWRMLNIGDIRERLCVMETAGDVIQEILKLNDEQKILCSCLLWRSWLRRNKINVEGKKIALTDLVGQVKYWANESKQCLEKQKADRVTEENVGWQKPEGEAVKFNCDGAFRSDTRTRG
jgi:hypothetical protein